MQPEFHSTGDHANSLPAAADKNTAADTKLLCREAAR